MGADDILTLVPAVFVPFLTETDQIVFRLCLVRQRHAGVVLIVGIQCCHRIGVRSGFVDGGNLDFLRPVCLIMFIRKLLCRLLFCDHVGPVGQVCGHSIKVRPVLITGIQSRRVRILTAVRRIIPRDCINLIQIVGKERRQVIIGLFKRLVQCLVINVLCGIVFGFLLLCLVLVLAVVAHQLRRLVIQVPGDGKLAHHVRGFCIADCMIGALFLIAQRTPGGIGLVFIVPFIRVGYQEGVKKLVIVIVLDRDQIFPAFHLLFVQLQDAGIALVGFCADGVAPGNVDVGAAVTVKRGIHQDADTARCDIRAERNALGHVLVERLRVLIICQDVVSVYAGQRGGGVMPDLREDLRHVDL